MHAICAIISLRPPLDTKMPFGRKSAKNKVAPKRCDPKTDKPHRHSSQIGHTGGGIVLVHFSSIEGKWATNLIYSVFDICWYTLARKMSEDVAPEDKGTSADKKEKPEGVVMSCPFCGEAFVRRSNRSKTCGRPKCETARNTLNQRNSRKKRKIQAQQSK